MEAELLNLKEKLKAEGLEKEKIEQLLMAFDTEVNKQHIIIQSIKDYCMKSHMTIEEYDTLVNIVGE